MQIPTEITFHEMLPSDAVESAIQRWVARFEHMNSRIVRCHVVVDQPHKHHRQGREFEIHLVLSVPGEDIAARVRHEDVYVAIADAFRAARRQLKDQVEVRRAFVKTPALRDTMS